MSDNLDPNAQAVPEPATPAVPAAQPVAGEMPAPQNRTIRTFDTRVEGLTAGLLDVPEEFYPQFLVAIEHREEAMTRLQEAKLLAQNLKLKAAETRQKRLTEMELVAQKEAALARTEQAVATISAEKATQREALEAKKAEREAIKPGYSLVPILLFLIAGVVFILADISITHDIVSEGLNITDKLESWLFAVGLAFVAFLFKPAYDRIFEKSYPDTSRKRTHWFLFSLSLAGIAMLVILGVFRYESGKGIEQQEKINKEIRALNTLKAVADDAEAHDYEVRINALEIKLAEQNELLATHWSRLWGVVMAGVLMAIAGAVCLGITFPALERLWQKNKVLPGIINQAGKSLEVTEASLNQQLDTQAQTKSELAVGRVRLSQLPDTEALDLQLKEAQTEISKQLQLLHNAEAMSSTALFRDSLERGRVLSERYQVVITWNDDGSFSLGRQARRTGNNSSSTRTPRAILPSGQYLHQRLRNFLAEKLND